MGTEAYEAKASQQKQDESVWRSWPVTLLLFLVLVLAKFEEYLIMGTVSVSMAALNAFFFLVGAAISLAGANFICYLRGIRWQLSMVLWMYLLTSWLMMPVTVIRILTILRGDRLHPSFDGLVVKLCQMAIFFIWMARSRNFPPQFRRHHL